MVTTGPGSDQPRRPGINEPEETGEGESSTLMTSTKVTATSSQNYFFPRDLPPRAVQLWQWENLAIPICYWTVGIVQGMWRPLLNVYPLDLGASEAQQATLSAIATLPCAFKIVFGFVSDTLPIAGYRRKPYMLAGWFLTSVSIHT